MPVVTRRGTSGRPYRPDVSADFLNDRRRRSIRPGVKPSSGRTPAWYAAACLALVATHPVAPAPAQPIIYLGVSLSALVACGMALTRMTGTPRRPWWLL